MLYHQQFSSTLDSLHYRFSPKKTKRFNHKRLISTWLTSHLLPQIELKSELIKSHKEV